MFLFNLYLYSKSLIVGLVPVDVAQARVLASTSVGLILSLMPLTIARDKNHPIKLSPSHPVVFTTTSLVLAATTLLLVSIVDYLFTIGNAESAAVIQPFFLFLGVLFIGFNLASASRRAKIRVWAFKNFFQTKYNYNDEWRHLSERLARKSSNEHYGDIAIRAVLPIYNGTGGVFYLFKNDDKGGSYSPETKIIIDDDLEPINDWDSPAFFNRMLINNWIFVPLATDPGLAKFNDLLPGQLRDLDSTLIILPLINNAKLLGFLAITAEMDQVDRFDWEDIDLLRMVGKQITNFVGNQILSEELVVIRQFQAYHQFTTFVMHDLKNLIAQQALVVENAGRFADNPEFIADAIKTIDNSVKKMDQLLLTINQNRVLVLEQSHQHPVSLIEVFESVLTKCHGREPNPVLHQEGELLLVDADSDNLLMAFTHLITNAQEACDSSGNIDIYLKRTNSFNSFRSRIFEADSITSTTAPNLDRNFSLSSKRRKLSGGIL